MIGVSLFSAEIKAVTNLIVQLRAAKFRPVSMDYNEYTTMLYAYTNTLFHFQINHTHARTHTENPHTYTLQGPIQCYITFMLCGTSIRVYILHTFMYEDIHLY